MEYYLIDKNNIVSNIFKSELFDRVANEYLAHIDMILNAFIDNKIHMPFEKLNFDNLQIVQVLSGYQNSKPFIVNTYKLNLSELQLIGLDSTTISLLIPTFNYITKSISDKMAIITEQVSSNSETKLTSANRYQVQNKHPVKNIFDQANELLNSPQKVIELGPRQIPTVNVSTGINDTNIKEENKIINPDVPRTMDSVLFEKNPENLKKTMESLQELKKIELDKLETLKKTVKDDVDNFTSFYDVHANKKRDYRKKLEKEKGRKSKFEANKLAYGKMKKDIDKGKLQESKISELFAKEYPIYKFMDQRGLLDKDDDYIIYLNIYDGLYPDDDNPDEEEYVPHNIHYLDECQQEKYKISQNKDLVDEFLTQNKPTKTYPSLEEVTNAINNELPVNLTVPPLTVSQNTLLSVDESQVLDIDLVNVDFENPKNERINLIENILKIFSNLIKNLLEAQIL